MINFMLEKILQYCLNTLNKANKFNENIKYGYR
jgi:hypothetical protein